MNIAPRQPGLPRGLGVGSAIASSLCGLVLLVAGPTVSAPSPRGLVPATVVDHVLRQLPAEARNIRFNGLYGSGHAGAWQFVAHLTWREGRDDIRGGTVQLPVAAGQPPFKSGFDSGRLGHEERIGWTPDAMREILGIVPDVSAPLMLVEFVPDVGARPAPIVVCSAPRPGTGSCTGYSQIRKETTFADDLIELTFAEALSIQRRNALVGVPARGPEQIAR